MVFVFDASMPRCCNPIPSEFALSYASVLLYGNDPVELSNAVHHLETMRSLTSCFTAWCPNCKRTYMLTKDLERFPTPSAHHTHQLALLKILCDSGAVFSEED